MNSTSNPHPNSQILFLVNPISGGKRKDKLITKLVELLPQKGIEAEVILTTSKEDTIQQAAEAVRKNYKIVVAVGGDGTINDIASQLSGTNTSLGVIPMGSGNGLSRELKIPFNIEKAVDVILRHRVMQVDTGYINDKPFFNIAGIGFDAHIAGLFEQAKSRGLIGYIKLILQSFHQYVPEKYTIHLNGKTFSQTSFLIAVCNGRQFGNNAWVNPEAILDDGKFNITVIRSARWFEIPGLLWWMFQQKIKRSNQVDTFIINEIRIERENDGLVNIDGEPVNMSKTLYFNIVPKSLKVIH
jgi:diacylglycerol kinase (ATP)